MKLNIKKIDSELKRLGWSRIEFMKKLKAPKSFYYYLVENPSTLTFTTVNRIAKVLKLNPKDLII